MYRNTVKVRYANAADNILLAEMGRQTFYDTFAKENTPKNMSAYLTASFSPEKQAAELAEPSSIFLIAEIKESAVGYARLKQSQPPACITGTCPIELARLYARSAWIGCGVGMALMKACLAEAKKNKHDTIWLDVWERNHRARSFYLKWGFADVGTQKFLLGDDLQNDILMQKNNF